MHKTIQIQSFLVILFALSISFTRCGTSQPKATSAETISKEEPQNEKVQENYPSGGLKMEGQMFNGLKSGEWKKYYENGELQSVENFKEGERDGYHKTDYSGGLCMEGFYKDGEKVGEWKHFFKDSGAMKYFRVYDDQGKPTGEWSSYYDSGELSSIENFSNGKADGDHIDYYKNGNVYRSGEKKDGREIGDWKIFDENGTLIRTTTH